jgi:hypothetical protein
MVAGDPDPLTYLQRQLLPLITLSLNVVVTIVVVVVVVTVVESTC